LGLTERLACQTRLDKTGEVVARQSPLATAKAETEKAARQLTFKQQVGAFIELEATKISAAINSFREQSDALVGKFLNLKPQNPESKNRPEPGASTPKS
jgi:hypothetical protein